MNGPKTLRIVVDQFHGPDAYDDAWSACRQMAQVITRAGVAERYGVMVQKRLYVNGRARSWARAVILVDRTPDSSDPKPLSNLAKQLQQRYIGP